MLLFASAALAWNELRTDHVEASSFLRSNWNKYEENYHPNYAFDDDPRTGWVEGVEGNGEGQWLEWQVSPLASARQVKLAISNGYQKSEKLLAANAAPKDVRIELRDAGGKVVAGADATLDRKMGAQEIVVPTTSGFTAVRLVVKTVWPGSSYKDTVVSDIHTWVDSDVPYRAAVEAKKLTTLRAWITERVNTAKFFASQPAAYPYKSAVATTDPVVEHPPSLCASTFQPWAQTLAALAADTTWYQLKLPPEQPAPDGVWEIPPSGWLDSHGIGLLETPKSIASHTKEDGEEAWWEVWTGNVHVRWADSARSTPRTIYAWSRHAGEERATFDYKEEAIYAYDDAGHLVATYAPGNEESTGSAWLTMFEWVDGKVVRLTSLFGPIDVRNQDFQCVGSVFRF